MLITLANDLGKVSNSSSLEGHTDAQPYAGHANYSNWELFGRSRHASRRLMQQNGLRDDQVVEVRGFADQRLRNPSNPTDAANRKNLAHRPLYRTEGLGLACAGCYAGAVEDKKR